MAEYSSTTAAEEQVAVIISDSEGEDNGIVENFDGSPHITLPPEVWAAVINCKYCCIYIINIYRSCIYIDLHLYSLDRPTI